MSEGKTFFDFLWTVLFWAGILYFVFNINVLSMLDPVVEVNVNTGDEPNNTVRSLMKTDHIEDDSPTRGLVEIRRDDRREKSDSMNATNETEPEDDSTYDTSDDY